MWNTVKRSLIVASVALNVAFVGMWIVRAVASHSHPRESSKTTPQQRVWCPLHRELAVTEEQWARIEPRLREFQAAVGKLTQRVKSFRSEVIDLIAADEPDFEVIRGKQDEVLATKRKIQGLVIAHLMAEKEILTPDQRTQLFQMLFERTVCTTGPSMSPRSLGPGMGHVLGNRKDDTSVEGTR